jgi:hypothetical protein
MPDPPTIYAALIEYVESHGFRRMEPGSGWWWSDESQAEDTIGPIVEELLHRDGVDTREAP